MSLLNEFFLFLLFISLSTQSANLWIRSHTVNLAVIVGKLGQRHNAYLLVCRLECVCGRVTIATRFQVLTYSSQCNRVAIVVFTFIGVHRNPQLADTHLFSCIYVLLSAYDVLICEVLPRSV
jgi:hypothetical protein